MRSAMPEFVISYDLKKDADGVHAAFLKAAEKSGLLYIFMSTDKIFRLPNTTVWGTFRDRDAAEAAFDAALAAAGKVINRTITLEKRFVTSIGSWSAKSDLIKKPQQPWIGKTKSETCRLHQLNDPYFKS
jgi:hypothetical protein